MRFGGWECWKSNRSEGRSGLGMVERSFFEFVEEGDEGKKGRLKAGIRPATFPPKPAQGRRPLAGLGLGRPKAGPRPAVLILCIRKKKENKRKERKVK